MRLLIVEDEAKTANYVAKGLREHGFIVDIASDGHDGVPFATTQSYDVLILDVMLPKLDGWSVLTECRANGVASPVLFLTARDSVDDRVRGLELGADDYLVKPFAFCELLARVRTIIRRGATRQPNVLRIADLETDFQRRRVVRGGHKIELSPKEFSLLFLLMRRSGEVLSRTLIAEQIWDINFNSDTNVVDVHIRRLRLKVDDPFELKLIHTVRGAGYVLEDRT